MYIKKVSYALAQVIFVNVVDIVSNGSNKGKEKGNHFDQTHKWTQHSITDKIKKGADLMSLLVLITLSGLLQLKLKLFTHLFQLAAEKAELEETLAKGDGVVKEMEAKVKKLETERKELDKQVYSQGD